MWAAREDRDDEGGGGRKFKNKSGGGKSMNAPVSFISGGFKKTAKEQEVRVLNLDARVM